MIKSNKTLQVITAEINVTAILKIQPRFEMINTDISTGVYSLKVQDFYCLDEVNYPIAQRSVEIAISEVENKEGSLQERITLALLDKVNECEPYGSSDGDWVIE